MKWMIRIRAACTELSLTIAMDAISGHGDNKS
jgi:hypothetical protein